MEVGEQRLIGPHQRELFRLRFFDLADDVRLRPDLRGRADDSGSRRHIGLIGQAGPDPRARLDKDRMPGLRQRFHSRRHDRHPVLIVLDLFDNPDFHTLVFLLCKLNQRINIRQRQCCFDGRQCHGVF